MMLFLLRSRKSLLLRGLLNYEPLPDFFKLQQTE